MSTRGRSSELTILVTAGLLMVALAIVSFLVAYTGAAPHVAGSSYSSRPEGTRVAYLVLKELGHDLGRSFDPIAALRGEPSASVLVLANPILMPSKQDERALRAFVAEGGVVVAFGPSAWAFLPDVAVAKLRGEADVDRRRFPAALPGALTHGAAALLARRQPVPALGPEYAVAYGTAEEPAIVVGRFGDGRIVWCLDHVPVQNDGIGAEDNMRMLANAVGAPGERTIFWDEYYHGERRSVWSYLAGTPLAWGLAQLGLIALAGFAAVGRRRGPLYPRLVEPRTSPLEFVETMASLYERARTDREAIETARTRLRRRLAAAAGLPVSAPDAQLALAAAARTGIDRERAMSALSAGAEAMRRGVRDRDAVAVVAELQELTASVASARAGRSL